MFPIRCPSHPFHSLLKARPPHKATRQRLYNGRTIASLFDYYRCPVCNAVYSTVKEPK
jgi:hypothetical protein